jgi:hypothetical protein
MKEIHSGMCRSHIAARALAGKAFKQGFYWPMAIRDSEKIIKTCKACQFAAKHQQRPGALSQLITPTWPLQRWGMDIVGPLPTAQGNFKFAVVAVEYFTKWIEARSVATITSATIRKFFWQQIICRFGVPKELTLIMGSNSIASISESTTGQLGRSFVLHPATILSPTVQSKGPMGKFSQL